jgi:uncharacterized membrane protein YjfL (UPF0719 family)
MEYIWIMFLYPALKGAAVLSVLGVLVIALIMLSDFVKQHKTVWSFLRTMSITLVVFLVCWFIGFIFFPIG